MGFNSADINGKRHISERSKSFSLTKNAQTDGSFSASRKFTPTTRVLLPKKPLAQILI